MFKTIVMGAALCLCATSTMSQTRFGTFGEGVEFFVSKMSRGEEGPVHQAFVNGYTVNVNGQRREYEVTMRCTKPGTMFVTFGGINFELKSKDRSQWETKNPMSGGFFALHSKYCTGKYQGSTMSAKERKAFSQFD